jgi:hypothetical protein
MSDELAEALLQVLRESPSTVEQLTAALNDGRIAIPAGRARAELAINGTAETVERVVNLTRAWAATGADGPTLAAVLNAMQERAVEVADLGPQVELVWTGPAGGASGVRATLPVMFELVEWVHRELIIVGYSLFLGGGDMQELLSRIAARSREGVDVRFIVDGDYEGYDGTEGGHSVNQIKNHWPRGFRRPTIYQWTDSKEHAKLHAKVVVADSRDVLVTSANLTGAAVGSNLEVGLRVRGEPARRTAEHFHALIADGMFDEVEWD